MVNNLSYLEKKFYFCMCITIGLIISSIICVILKLKLAYIIMMALSYVFLGIIILYFGFFQKDFLWDNNTESETRNYDIIDDNNSV